MVVNQTIENINNKILSIERIKNDPVSQRSLSRESAIYIQAAIRDDIYFHIRKSVL